MLCEDNARNAHGYNEKQLALTALTREAKTMLHRNSMHWYRSATIPVLFAGKKYFSYQGVRL